MHDESVNLEEVIQQFQLENERLRAELAKARKFNIKVPWERIKLEAANIIENHYFWIGYFIALFISFCISRLERINE